jgi:translation initiation factor 2 beta subunit (eIF-2beta)/eIF-5
MATININRKINDIFHRYKMPKLQIRIEGTKTILINISAIGKDLNRSPICM